MFGRKKPQPDPVRRDQVLRLVNLGMRETDAADMDIDGPEFRQAKDAFESALGESTSAEQHAAFDALKRHGY
ncbi:MULTISPECIES: hypothetical protein [Micromonospora]|uniref:Uncharacterized protein n=1 Tax=Micromonospora carbonacea TaxID=47853 RepID=A0A1C4Z9U1_9ACTN|nr:hypothetical protein [Micromonospora carbonacea]SCF29644.1 hypothetical protein GA0070563_107399 [Micromonospora carbonacea]